MDELTLRLQSFAGSLWEWVWQPYNSLLVAVCLVVLLWLVLQLLRLRRRKKQKVARDPSGPGSSLHRWTATEFVDKPTYCNACHELCVSGSSCESCGLCLCSRSQCLKAASATHACKPMSSSSSPSSSSSSSGSSSLERLHFWVKGNLPLCSLCFRYWHGQAKLLILMIHVVLVKNLFNLEVFA